MPDTPLVSIQSLLAARQQDAFPESFAGDHDIIGCSSGPLLQKSETEMLAAIGQPFVLHETCQLHISAVSGLDVLPPTRPDAVIVIGRADLASACVGVGDQVYTLDVFHRGAPV